MVRAARRGAEAVTAAPRMDLAEESIVAIVGGSFCVQEWHQQPQKIIKTSMSLSWLVGREAMSR